MKMKCLACGHDIKKLMTFEDMPASAQDIPTKDELNADHPITLELCQCTECGLVQFDCEPVSYYKDVIRAGGGTSTMTKLRHEEYARLLEHMREHSVKGRNIVEVGCGRGEFLRMWQNLAEDEAGAEALEKDMEKDPLSGQPKSLPLKLTGIEHKKELVDEANAHAEDYYDAQKVRNSDFDIKVKCFPKVKHSTNKGHFPKVSYRVYEGFAEGDYTYPDGPFDAFVQFNFLEHQPYPKDMLQNIWHNLKPKALGLVTVPSFEYILQYNGYYELLHDHIANYTEFTLQKLFQDNGFEVLDMRLVNRDTIEIIVKKTDPDDLTNLRYNGQLIDVSFLKESYDRLNEEVNAHLTQLSAENKTMAIWGASHQGFTLAATTKLGGKVKYIIDSAKFKQGKYAPASHIPIVSPDHFATDPVDEILIVAPGYTDEIAGIIRERYGADVRILVLKTDKIDEYK
ncbi:methyltransferase domain-containing protein [Oribacterium sp. NK2B42]|uniref:methyltransferase domain-containing protein n=1 Tax=Oribacterium sp. NK2B42 TaxID=689781 RepID=UPI000412D44F|nr:methyltransferase domain-containing protein [Oribacterium sp. NK2B42]